MKKSLEFSVCGIRFKISLLIFLSFFLIYCLGMVFSFIIDIDLGDKLLSPLLLFYSGDGFLEILLHSFIYFFLFTVLALFFGTSYFGFFLIPVLVFFKAFFSCLSVSFLFFNSDYFLAFVFYGLFLSIEAAFLLIYFAQSFSFSFDLIKHKKSSIDVGLSHGVFSLVFMSVIAVLFSAFKYLF